MISLKTVSDPVIKALLRKLLNSASRCYDPGNNVSLFARTEELKSLCRGELKGRVNLQRTRRSWSEKKKNPLFSLRIVSWERSLPSQTSNQVSFAEGDKGSLQLYDSGPMFA